jgi:hypothetical protein
MPDGIILVLPESAYTAGVAVLAPQFGIDMAFFVQGCDKIVSMTRGAIWKFLRSCELQPDVSQHMLWGGSHEISSGSLTRLHPNELPVSLH